MSEYRGSFTSEAAEAYLAAEPGIHTESLAERIWTATDGHCRAVFVEGDTGVIAFDTFGTPGRARAYGKAIAAAVPGKEITHVIYTHDHLDHAGFAAVLAPDAEIIADETCARVVKLRQADGQLPPTRVLKGERNDLEIDGVAFTLLNPGPTHGSGNMSAWFAGEKILYSSDTVLANARYGFMPDYHLANFVRFMRGFLALDWQTFVPGRFELSDREGFMRGCDYIEAMQTECQNAFAEFVPIWAYEAMYGYVSGKLKARFGDLDGFDQHVGQTAIRVVHHYLMGGWGLEDTPEAAVLLADAVPL
jgi:glyoxylase-like metal-dependent hydrolase (beta-lactamase superfamily II)